MPSEGRIVAVTGANGFIGRNLVVRLREQGFTVRPIVRDTNPLEAHVALSEAEIIFHLAGANRPEDPSDFFRDNADFTALLTRTIRAARGKPMIIFSSSTKATDRSEYGRSKRAAERELLSLAMRGGADVAIYRLPNIFGKWAIPDYNSAVATFCHNIARGLPIRIDDPDAPLMLVHIDDLIDQWLSLVDRRQIENGFVVPLGVHQTTVGKTAALIKAFAARRATNEDLEVYGGFERALYSSFIAALPPTAFSYPLASRCDQHGSLIALLKTPVRRSISIFSTHPGGQRTGRYHHRRVEKLLVVKGAALFRFRHILTGEQHEVRTSGGTPVIVDTIPGWAQDVTNVGDERMVSLVWANEKLDPARPDTVVMSL